MKSDELKKRLEEAGFEWKQVHAFIGIFQALEIEKMDAETAKLNEKHEKFMRWSDRALYAMLGFLSGFSLAQILFHAAGR